VVQATLGRSPPPQKKQTQYPTWGSLGRPQGRSGRVQKISAPTVFNPRTVQPVASPYTDCAIPAHVNIMTNVNICRTESLIMKDGKVSVRSLPTTFLAPVLNIWTIVCVKKQLGDSFPLVQSRVHFYTYFCKLSFWKNNPQALRVSENVLSVTVHGHWTLGFGHWALGTGNLSSRNQNKQSRAEKGPHHIANLPSPYTTLIR
jgi:hypothetical protein